MKDTVSINVLNSFMAPVVNLTLQGVGQMIASWNDINPGLPYEVNINNTGWVPSNNGLLSHLIGGLSSGDIVNVEVRSDVSSAACNVSAGAASLAYQFCPIDAFPTNQGPYAVNCSGTCDEAVQISVVSGQSPFNYIINNTTTNTSSTQTNGNLSGLCAGVYQIIVSDATMCMDTVNLTVNDQTPLTVTISQTNPVSCVNGNDGCASATATGGVGGYTYQWSNPNMSNQQAICGLEVGPITVTVTDQNGCSATATLQITGLPALSINLTKTDVNCLNGTDGTASVVASGGESPYSYQWSAGSTPAQSSTNGLIAGLVSVTVTDNNGCQAFGSVTLLQPTTGVQVDAVQTVISCYSQNESVAQATANGGTSPYGFSWSPGNLSTASISNISIGNYTVTVTDANGCTSTDMVLVEQWDAYNINISTTPPSCNGIADGQMNAVVLTGGDGIYSYEWSNGDNGDFLSDLAGGVTYTVTVTDGQGCTGTASRLLENPMPLAITMAKTDLLCYGDSNGTATVANVGGGTAPFSYLWDTFAQSQTTVTATDLQAGTYSVEVTDAAGCTNTAEITIGQPALISVDFETVNNECFGDEAGIAEAMVDGGTPGYTFQWSNGGNAAKQTELAADSYYLTITDANGCIHLDSVFISAPQRVRADLTIKNVSCFGDRDGSISITPIGGTPPFTYSLDGQQFFGSSTLIALEADDYDVYIKDINGCVFSIPATVEEPPKLTVDILVWNESVEEYVVEYGSRIPLLADIENAQGNVFFTWDAAYCGTLEQDTMSDCTGTLTSSALWSTPDYSNDYFVLAIDSMGCEAEDHLQVHVTKVRRVVVPTGFSPNESGTNDRLVVHGKSGTMIKLFQVFDRWGELVFQDVDIPINELSRGWDGTFKSKEMPPGVYAWYLEAEYEDGMTENFRGETTLIR
jgi:gliding motility-associated-like protein